MAIDDFYITKVKLKKEFLDEVMDDVYGEFSSLPSKWDRNGFSIDHVMRWAIEHAMSKINSQSKPKTK